METKLNVKRSREPGSVLLPSKLHAPLATSSHIHRTQLVERCLRASVGQVVLFRAPAGFGKTTTMLQLKAALEENASNTAWLTVDEADNDVMRFLSYLAEAMRKVSQGDSGLQESCSGMAGCTAPDMALMLMEALRNATAPFVLFLDNFEVIQNQSVFAILKEMIGHLPLCGKLVIASRSVPDIGLGRLRARCQLIEVEQADLRFSYEESREFMAGKRGLVLDEPSLSRLHASTEGWVTALNLASVSLEKKIDAFAFLESFDGTTSCIADFLAEDVLASLPKSIKHFLLQTSILEVFSPELCDAVCLRCDSAELLQEMERSNLFLSPTDERRTEYRYHGLFSGYLRAQLERDDPNEARELRRRAAQWFKEQSRLIPAIEYALSSGDIEYALPMLSEQALTLLLNGRIRLVSRWLDKVPRHLRSKYPSLDVTYIWSIMLTRGLTSAEKLLEDIERGASLTEEVRVNALALRPLLMSFRDNIDDAYEVARENLEKVGDKYPFAYGLLVNSVAQLSLMKGRFDEARSAIMNGGLMAGDRVGAFNLVFRETVEADIEMCRGHLRQAIARLRQASAGESSRTYLTNGNAKAGVTFACALYEAGDWEMAERLLNIYVPLVQELGLPDQLISSYLVLSRVHGIRKNADRQLQCLAELEYLGRKLQLPRVSATARLERARLALLGKNVEVASDELAQAGSTEFWHKMELLVMPANEVDTLTVARARHSLHTGEYSEAITMLERAQDEARQQGRGTRALKLMILLAAAYHLSAREHAGLKMMGDALAFGASQGFVRTFVEEGELVMDVVRDFQHSHASELAAGRHTVTQAYLEQLFIAEGRTTPQPADVSQVITINPKDALTPKELRVLRQLADGFSNIEIASKLFVAETTVRTHLRSISSKLCAKNRTQVVSIARKAGLVA